MYFFNNRLYCYKDICQTGIFVGDWVGASSKQQLSQWFDSTYPNVHKKGEPVVTVSRVTDPFGGERAGFGLQFHRRVTVLQIAEDLILMKAVRIYRELHKGLCKCRLVYVPILTCLLPKSSTMGLNIQTRPLSDGSV